MHPYSPSRRRLLSALGAAVAATVVAAPLSAHAGFNSFTSEYTATRDELQAQIAKRFPVQKRYADIFTVGLRDPQLGLDARNNRAAITAVLSISSPLLQPQTVQGIVSNVALAVTVVGSLVLLSGALILVGAVSMTKFRRVYEAAILKTLGASGRLIATMLVLEYGVLGAIAGTVGALGAVVLSWAVATYALELNWEPALALTLIGIAVTAVFVAVVGVVASVDVLRHKPLATLRAE